MKNKKILFLLVSVLIIILVLLFFIVKNFNNNDANNENTDISEYTPEEEISNVQLRRTLVTLFYLDSENDELKSEGKLIDSTELLNNPYQKLVELLINDPENQELSSVFPKGTSLLNSYLDRSCVILDFSPEILNTTYDNQKYYIINSLLNTLTELNEVDSIKILVNNSVPDGFEEKYSMLTNFS